MVESNLQCARFESVSGLVKKIRFKCNRCKKLRAKSLPSPPTSALPKFRAELVDPFSSHIHSLQLVSISLGPCITRHERKQPTKLILLFLHARLPELYTSSCVKTWPRVNSRERWRNLLQDEAHHDRLWVTTRRLSSLRKVGWRNCRGMMESTTTWRLNLLSGNSIYLVPRGGADFLND